MPQDLEIFKVLVNYYPQKFGFIYVISLCTILVRWFHCEKSSFFKQENIITCLMYVKSMFKFILSIINRVFMGWYRGSSARVQPKVYSNNKQCHWCSCRNRRGPRCGPCGTLLFIFNEVVWVMLNITPFYSKIYGYTIKICHCIIWYDINLHALSDTKVERHHVEFSGMTLTYTHYQTQK